MKDVRSWCSLGVAGLFGVCACTFPFYTLEHRPSKGDGGASGAGAVAGKAGDVATAGKAGDVATGGMAASAGAAEDGGSTAMGGEAGSPSGGAGPSDWSEPELERLGFSLLGAALLEADGVSLVREKDQRGGIAQTQALDLAATEGLHIEVTFRIKADAMPADGLALVIHASPAGPSALGNGGGGLGYNGLKPCLAIELDLFQTASDPAVPHLNVMPDCNSDNHGPSSTPIEGNVVDGKDWLLLADYDPSTQQLQAYLRNVETGDEAELPYSVDLFSVIGPEAFLAVTAGTGGFFANHQVTGLLMQGAGLGTRALSQR